MLEYKAANSPSVLLVTILPAIRDKTINETIGNHQLIFIMPQTKIATDENEANSSINTSIPVLLNALDIPERINIKFILE